MKRTRPVDVAANSVKVHRTEKTKIMAVGLPCVVTRKLRGRAERQKGSLGFAVSCVAFAEATRQRFFMTKILKE